MFFKADVGHVAIDTHSILLSNYGVKSTLMI